MGNYREHALYGFTALITLTILLFILKNYGALTFTQLDVMDDFVIRGFAIPIVIVAFAIGMYSTLLPDIDIGTSKIFHFTVGLLLLIAIAFILIQEYRVQTVAILLFIFGLLFLEHRGMMHSKTMGFVFAIIFGIAFSSCLVGLYVLVGYYTHLVVDKDFF